MLQSVCLYVGSLAPVRGRGAAGELEWHECTCKRARTRELGHRLDAPQRLNHLVLSAAQPASALCL